MENVRSFFVEFENLCLMLIVPWSCYDYPSRVLDSNKTYNLSFAPVGQGMAHLAREAGELPFENCCFLQLDFFSYLRLRS